MNKKNDFQKKLNFIYFNILFVYYDIKEKVNYNMYTLYILKLMLVVKQD